jgi:hypothetical protein
VADVVNTIMSKLVPLEGSILLKCIFKKWEGRHGTNLLLSGYRNVVRCCEHVNEHTGSNRWKDNIKMRLQEMGREAWDGFTSFRIRKCEQVLLTQ